MRGSSCAPTAASRLPQSCQKHLQRGMQGKAGHSVGCKLCVLRPSPGQCTSRRAPPAHMHPAAP